MNTPLPAPGPAPRRNWARRLVNVLVALVVVAVAAATFVFSYDGVHAIALLGGVSAQLARYYPGLFDAVLVIACVAAMVLRDGRWWARLWAWTVIIVVLAAIGTTDVLHAANFKLPHRTTEGIVAAAPVVAVLLAFSLLLTLLRQTRTNAAQQPAAPVPPDVPALPAAASAAPIALPAAPVTRTGGPAERDAALQSAATVSLPAAAPDSPAPGLPPTRDIPVADDAWEVPAAATAQFAHPVTKANEIVTPAPQTKEAPVRKTPAAAEPAAHGEPAPPTVQVPALSPTVPPETAAVRRPPGIRYAGSGVPAKPAGPDPGPAAPTAAVGALPPDYWDAEEGRQFAGLVYQDRGEQADPGEAADQETGIKEAARPAPTPELDDDAPPFATAPFTAVPRLNRVRSTPAPPADEDEDEDQ
jgi:Protein of unknown function (DUF2637)